MCIWRDGEGKRKRQRERERERAKTTKQVLVRGLRMKGYTDNSYMRGHEEQAIQPNSQEKISQNRTPGYPNDWATVTRSDRT